jgi:hypothetical protein
MTVLCVAATSALPGVQPCAELGLHRVRCPDHPGFQNTPGVCRGCLPRSADRGFLCDWHFSLVEHAYAGWARWSTLIEAAGGRAVSANGGGGSAALGYSNLSLAFLELDACTRHLATRGDRTLLLWVNDPDGAGHAIQFAHAALNAYRTLEVEEREKRTPPPARCPHCGLLTLTRNTERQVGAFTVIDCQHCGGQLDKIRTGPDSWGGSHACESDTALDHIECPDVDCDCWCHLIGAKSRHAGIPALWDADLATAAPGSAPRDEWVITDPHTITRTTDERKTA